MEPLVKNAANREQIQQATDKIELLRDQELNDLRVLLNLREGRRFLYRLVNQICRYDSKMFDNSGSITSFNLGMRDVGKMVKSDALEANYENYQLAEKENWSFLNKKKGNKQ